MKKRLLCLVLCLFLTLPVILTSCDSDLVVDNTPDLQTITLAMIQGENTTEAGVAAVERALNDIIEPLYNLHIEVQVYPKDIYYQVIKGKLLAAKQEIADEEAAKEDEKELLESLKDAGLTLAPDEDTEAESDTEPLTWLDEDGDPHYVYPDAEENQVDIFLVTDIAQYYDLIKTPVLDDDPSPLIWNMTDRLNEKHKGLRKIINSNFFDAVTVDGAVYGIPNNHIVGEYTYLLLNKDICTEQLNWPGTYFKTLNSLKEYFTAVRTYCDPDIKMLYNLPESNMVHFTENFSFFGGYDSGAPEANTGTPPRNALANSNFQAYLKDCNAYREAGYVTEGDKYAIPEGEVYAAAFLTGGPEIVEKYGDEYHVVTYAQPKASSYDLYGSIFCVGAYSEVPETCMEIISLLTTDAELRNVLQYGRLNVTYTEDEDTGMVTPITDTDAIWDPDPLYTGNQFLLKQSTTMTERELELSANNWEVGKQLNAGMVLDFYAKTAFQYVTAETLKYRYENDLDENLEKDEEGNPVLTLEEYIAAYEAKYLYTADWLKQIEEYSAKKWEELNSFVPGEIDPETGEEITFEMHMNKIIKEVGGYTVMTDAGGTKNPDSPSSQYTNFRNNTVEWE